MKIATRAILSIALMSSFLTAAAAEKKLTRDQMVLKDRADVSSDATWIYNDLPSGIAEAKRTNKPLMVLFRCIP